MFDFITENDAQTIQAGLLKEGYELEGSMADPVQFAEVLTLVFDNLKDELLKYPGSYLFTHMTGNLMSDYERAEGELRRRVKWSNLDEL
jgi:hypothetical protein